MPEEKTLEQKIEEFNKTGNEILLYEILNLLKDRERRTIWGAR